MMIGTILGAIFITMLVSTLYINNQRNDLYYKYEGIFEMFAIMTIICFLALIVSIFFI